MVNCNANLHGSWAEVSSLFASNCLLDEGPFVLSGAIYSHSACLIFNHLVQLNILVSLSVTQKLVGKSNPFRDDSDYILSENFFT